MPALSNAKHERFAQNLAKGMSQDEAYRDAGYTPDAPNASRLTRNDKVQARVAEITERGAVRAEITLATLVGYADDIRSKAAEAGQYSAAVSAVKELGVLTGLRVEKRENLNRGLNDMSDDELADIARAGGASSSDSARGTAKPH